MELRRRPPAAGPPVPGRPRRRRGAAEDDQAPGRGRAAPPRRSSVDPGEGVRQAAQGGLVGARAGRRRAAGEARPRGAQRRGRCAPADVARTTVACTRSCATSGRSPAIGRGYTRRHPASSAALPDVRSSRSSTRNDRERAHRRPCTTSSARRSRWSAGAPAACRPRSAITSSCTTRSGEPCPRCGADLRRVSYEDYEVTYCPDCQTGGKVLADRRLSPPRSLSGYHARLGRVRESARAPT